MLISHEGPAIPGTLRQHNRLTVLRLLRTSGPTTKPALAKETGISRPTVAKVIDDLETEGLVENVGMTPPGQAGGKPGMLYRYRAGGIRSGAVFLRVDTLYVAIIDGEARIQARAEYPLGEARQPEPVIALIVRSITDLLTGLGLTTKDLLGVGVGVPGITSYHSGVVHLAPHLPGWAEVPLGAILAERLHTPVWVDNDCHVQALAERHFGLGQAVDHFVSVQSGIGLSAALYLDGTLYRGAHDTAGEIGHMPMEENGPLCKCGNRGCWEALASTERLVAEASQGETGTFCPPDWLKGRDERDIPPMALDAMPTALIATYAQRIFHAARQGQPEAIDLVLRYAYQFGKGLITLVNMVDPQRIIIWGDAVDAGELFLVTVRSVVRQHALRRSRETCEILFSPLDQDVGLIGAGTLTIDALFEGAVT